MTSSLLEKYPLNKEQITELRSKVIPKLLETPDLYYESDVERFKIDDLYVHRFLVHQRYLYSKLDMEQIIEKSFNMVIDDFKWRKEFGVREIRKQDLPEEFFERKGSIIFNEDKSGRTIMIIQAKKIRKTDPEEKLLGEKFVVYWLENIYQSNRDGITVLVDCTDAGLSNINMDLIDFTRFLFTYRYPCFLGYFLVYHMPWLFTAIWNFVKRFLTQNGIDRIKFVDQKSILEFVDKDKLPVSMGGDDESEFKYEESLIDTDKICFHNTDNSLVQNTRS